MRRPPIGLRRRLQLSVTVAVALVLVVLIVAFNVVLRSRLSAEANNALFSRATAELASLRVSGGRLVSPELPDAAAVDAQTWVFTGGRVLEQPRSDHATQLAAQELSRGARRTREVPSSHVRLYAVPVVVSGGRLGTVVAQVSLTPYEKTAQTAAIASIVLGAAVLALVAIAARVLIAAALRPVAHMTAQAAAWSETDADRRFGLGPPRDEFSQLAATLDNLLDRVASSLRHEQRFSAELSHELRSPLSSVIAEAQLALRHPRGAEDDRAGYARVLASAQQMARTLETLVTVARMELAGRRGTGDAAAAARDAARGCEAVAERYGVAIEVADLASPVRIGVDPDVAERVLAPLVENGCRYGSSLVSIDIERRDGTVVFTITDDGPGVAGEDREHVFEPGWRGNGRGDGAGLGLPLARRLARAAGGDVEVVPDAGGGRFSVRLPGG